MFFVGYGQNTVALFGLFYKKQFACLSGFSRGAIIINRKSHIPLILVVFFVFSLINAFFSASNCIIKILIVGIDFICSIWYDFDKKGLSGTKWTLKEQKGTCVHKIFIYRIGGIL